VADAPDSLTLSRHRDRPAFREVHIRRLLLFILAAFLLLGLLNLFGQRPSTSTAAAPGVAKFDVYAPSRARGGLYYEVRFHVQAISDIKDAQLVLSSGWLEGLTINTIEPSPLSEATRNGKLVLDLGHIPAGERYLLFMQTQVNPTNVGYRSQRAELWDGKRMLATISRHIAVFP
jgi:hypothetical protein